MSDLPTIQKQLKKIVKIKNNFTRSCKRIGSKGDGADLRGALDQLENDYDTQSVIIQTSLKTLQASKNIVRTLKEDV